MRAEEIIKKKNEYIRFLESRIHNLRKQRDETDYFYNKRTEDLRKEIHEEKTKFLDLHESYYELLDENTQLRLDSKKLEQAHGYIKDLEDKNNRLEKMLADEITKKAQKSLEPLT